MDAPTTATTQSSSPSIPPRQLRNDVEEHADEKNDEDAPIKEVAKENEKDVLPQTDSFFIRKRSNKTFLMRVKPSQRELESSDGDEEEDDTHQGCCCPMDKNKKKRRRHHSESLSSRLRQFCCCRSIHVLRLADTCCCVGSCCCCCSGCCPMKQANLLVVRVPVRSVDSLIDNDSPFAFPRINQEVLEYILEKTWDQITYGQPTQITVETLNVSDVSRGKEISVAFSNTFRHEAKMQNYELIRTTADGTASCIMSIGIIICLLGILIPLNVIVLTDNGNITPGWLVAVNGLIIVVLWVAVWHPVELLIYGRHMTKLRRSLCRTLAESKVIIVSIDPEKADDNNDYEFDEIDLV